MRNSKLLLCFIFVGHFSFAIECEEVLEKVINAYEAENSTAKRIKEGTIPTAKILSHQNLGEIQENHFLKIPSLFKPTLETVLWSSLLPGRVRLHCKLLRAY